MKNWFNSLSFQMKLVVGAAGIAAIYYIIKLVMAQMKKAKLNAAFNSDFDDLLGAGQKPSLPKNTYMMLADKIYAAGCYGIFCSGTDEAAMYDAFNQMQNDLDITLLSKAFGFREPRGGFCIPGTNCDISLGEWLPSELNQEEIGKINKLLLSKGIKSVF